MEKSIVQKKQSFGKGKVIEDGNVFKVKLRYDDECGNGHNTFAITGEVRSPKGRFLAGGCLHDEIRKYFPKYAHLIPYHGCTSKGPMHYIANTLYHAKEISKHQGRYYFYLENKLIKIVNEYGAADMRIKYGENCKFEEYFNPMAKEPDLEAARNSAIWPDAALEQLRDEEQLLARLPELLKVFRQKMLDLGFIW